MEVGRKCIELVKEFEGWYPKAYKCPAGVNTIGYGHTGGVKLGTVITKEEGERLLKKDLEESARQVEKLVKVPLNQNQFDALVSFVFNVGSGNLSKSTLLRKLNTKDYNGASEEFKRWNRAAGKILNGLVRRREEERKLFLGLR